VGLVGTFAIAVVEAFRAAPGSSAVDALVSAIVFAIDFAMTLVRIPMASSDAIVFLIVLRTYWRSMLVAGLLSQ